MLSPGMYRFLSLCAFVALVPLLSIYGLLMYISVPSAHGGMEPTMAMVCYIALTTIFGALSIVAVNFGLQLSREASGKFTTP